MTEPRNPIEDLSSGYQDIYRKNKVILSFSQFIELVRQNPRRFIRNALDYLLNTIEGFGHRNTSYCGFDPVIRHRIFDLGTERGIPIIGGEAAQREIVQALQSFRRLGHASRLVLLHGPNGSAKTSTIDAIASGMQRFSASDEGAIYRFNWVFPTDRDNLPPSQGESSKIGFGSYSRQGRGFPETFALFDDQKISARLISEYKENPLFLLPMPQREQLLRSWIASAEGLEPEQVTLPQFILGSGLSKMNQQIFENLLNAYDGSLSRVYAHIQVERFFFSRQYRVGISTVEPQMSVDAREKQVTLDKNYQNLPAALHTISFFQAEGELVEANRGILEFSDLLKRPPEAFKYLLSAVEKSSVNLSSGTAQLDLVFLGTVNEKHLDAFKTLPDFSSFKGRMELIAVPYLLLPDEEAKIYREDIKAIEKLKPLSPHTLRFLCCWAVMTRLKQPDPEQYPKEFHDLLARIDPYSKMLLYEGKDLQPEFTPAEQSQLVEFKESLWKESQRMVVYEGRFGASPREIRTVLHRAAENTRYPVLTPVSIFVELKNMVKDHTVYDFLQFEPRGQYHNAAIFIDILMSRFLESFEKELVTSMAMADELEYEILLKKYVDHVVAEIKKDKIWDQATNSFVGPSQQMMLKIESILEIEKNNAEHRNALLSRVAAFKIDHPNENINVSLVFADFMDKIKAHFYEKMKAKIEKIYHAMLIISSNNTFASDPEIAEHASNTFAELEKRFGWQPEAAAECLRFLLKNRNSRKPSVQKSNEK